MSEFDENTNPIQEESQNTEAVIAEDVAIPAPETVQETSEPVYLQSSEVYKENIRQMKAEYKAAKKAERENVPQSPKGPSVWLAVLLTCAIMTTAFLLLCLFPTPKSSIVAKYISAVSGFSANGDSVELDGGTYYKPNKDTITIDADSFPDGTAVYAKVSPSIVGIRIVQISGGGNFGKTENTLSEGTGTVYSEDGKIITNYHVIQTAIENPAYNIEVRVYLDTTLQKYYVAEIIGGDSSTDLALIKINLNGMVPIEFFDSDSLKEGETVFTMGGGGGVEFLDSINKGIISGLHRNITTQTGRLYDLIQTDAVINPGNSGGALVTTEGKFAGVCFLKIAATGYDNLSFAIPSNTVKKIITQIDETGSVKTPVIGVVIDTSYTENIGELYGLPSGAYVSSVTEGGPAEKAGIIATDIITEVNGKKITDYYSLKEIISASEIGSELEVTFYRVQTKETKTVKVTVESSK